LTLSDAGALANQTLYLHLQAVESLNKICGELSSQQVEEYFIPLTIRLSKADWFTSKVSGCGLFTAPYSKVSPPIQEQLRQQFGQLVHDDTPMVRRQAATHMAKFVREMPAAIIVEEMIPMFQHLVQDDQDSVRLLTVEILISIAEVVPKEQQASHGVLLTSLRSLIEDKSWRVRYMISDRFEKVSGCTQGAGGPRLTNRRSLKPSTRRLCQEIWFPPL
jgi:serine/threonine-protein phosphatase 2A regulatory subunit A